MGFLEIRCITDAADAEAATSFHDNLKRVMPNIAELLMAWHSWTRGEANQDMHPTAQRPGGR